MWVWWQSGKDPKKRITCFPYSENRNNLTQSQNSEIILYFWPYFYFNINLWYPLFWNELVHRFVFQYTAPSQKNIPLCHSTPYSYSMVLGIQDAKGILVKYWCLGIKLLSHIQIHWSSIIYKSVIDLYKKAWRRRRFPVLYPVKSTNVFFEGVFSGKMVCVPAPDSK